MCVCACVDACVYIRMCVCMYVCVRVCTYVRMWLCTYVCTYICMYIRTSKLILNRPIQIKWYYFVVRCGIATKDKSFMSEQRGGCEVN